MSHHLDTPLARQNGQLYIDDLYVFPGHESTVFVMDVNSNVTEDHIQPGFHHEARYDSKCTLTEPSSNSGLPDIFRRSGRNWTTSSPTAYAYRQRCT